MSLNPFGNSRLLRGARRTLTGLHPALESLLAAVIGLLIGALLMYIWGFDPWKAYWALLQGAYGGSYEWASTLSRATPLILTALTFSVCVRAGMFNIGAEGQMLVGAMAAICVTYFAMPSGIHLLIGLVFAAAAGAAWSIVPALLKITRGVSEVISTIMFNWIGRWLALYLAIYVIVDPQRAEKTLTVPVTARFPILVRGTDFSYAFFLSLFVALVLYFILWHTTMGYEVRAAGLNPTAARYGGIRNKRTMIVSFLLGGAAAGLAGAAIVMGMPPSYAAFGGGAFPNLTNIGFDGMAVAMVGRNHPIGIIAAAVLFGGLNAGGRVMQFYGSNPVPLEMVRIVMGAIVLAMSVPELIRLFPAIRKQGQSLMRLLRKKGASSEEGST
ncbi:MAG: ABC transporter permease [Candidatus Bipolaricaulis sp.]|nr:ABC transporter permease [Candidatus Bipolaricaulis sp.]MDD5219126.1 ABC transporter permease [Candidatus Bipolaricaulis sp.]MDD5645943.1 ABC transporter permease [Candidatus Bipolaricaulis sp.]